MSMVAGERPLAAFSSMRPERKKVNRQMANVFGAAWAERVCTKYVDRLTSVAGVVATLNGPGPFTLFVPIDAPFDGLSADQQASLLADPATMAHMLIYHIMPGY
jgi:uncharacterized surface protein with fasciclin (FAS1) repeats